MKIDKAIRGIIRFFEIGAVKHERTCRVCGCTDNQACQGGCHWIERDLCSNCANHAEKCDCEGCAVSFFPNV